MSAAATEKLPEGAWKKAVTAVPGTTEPVPLPSRQWAAVRNCVPPSRRVPEQMNEPWLGMVMMM